MKKSVFAVLVLLGAPTVGYAIVFGVLRQSGSWRMHWIARSQFDSA
jgi:hypothetical protein